MKQPYNTALYYRLSRDDENFGDSVSIETQRTILQQFARDNQFHVVDEYIDDGWSGTNFDRPAFQRMMDDVDTGRINCIITKDLSRFGREHVMMDYYLEFVFPEKNIRYIAVTENEDTEKGLSDFVPFKNLFNAMLLRGGILLPSSIWKRIMESGLTGSGFTYFMKDLPPTSCQTSQSSPFRICKRRRAAFRRSGR